MICVIIKQLSCCDEIWARSVCIKLLVFYYNCITIISKYIVFRFWWRRARGCVRQWRWTRWGRYGLFSVDECNFLNVTTFIQFSNHVMGKQRFFTLFQRLYNIEKTLFDYMTNGIYFCNLKMIIRNLTCSFFFFSKNKIFTRCKICFM